MWLEGLGAPSPYFLEHTMNNEPVPPDTEIKLLPGTAQGATRYDLT
jgi:hypothetical protein